MNDFETTLACVRDLLQNPVFQSFADEYMKHREVYGNTDPVYGNDRPVYDELEAALRIVYEKQPETFDNISNAVQDISVHINVRPRDIGAGILGSAVSILQSLKNADSSVESIAMPALIVFLAILAELARGISIEEHSQNPRTSCSLPTSTDKANQR